MDIRFVYFLAAVGFVQCNLINLKCKGIEKFVDGHNSRRLKLAEGIIMGQPAAVKMNSIIWDEELAIKAGNWASRNKYGHNPDRTIPSGRFGTGENIYIYGTTDSSYHFDLEMALNSWFDEHNIYRYKPLEWSDFSSGKDIGHYTQMAWSDSVYLGCAISQFTRNNYNYFFVVCNYGPTGNYIGQTPYKSGQASGRLVCGAKDCSQKYGNFC